MTDMAAKIEKQPPYRAAQHYLIKLKATIRKLHDLAELIEHGAESSKEEGSAATLDASIPLAQFLQEIPKKLEEADSSLQEAYGRIKGLVF